ncbi:hypothetical protein DFQ01_109192 [Paenibacillus cellulosilyticus]|uniref:Uncharacterized protein n=1 Tax=Paenibacillus cellulosilyticus TaxID=375489 RepID=A0A2V2YTD0_9BACL|nr:hypothetical protein [Paenibacillus cellulosilyticus]PWW02567.1 hypothetical protein DFQ01_109192 [Paenibacillus cellulosilyticus]QKS47258.1 hypothetical protein HUB94_22750 [Paenibacillus cellulosilyticus]
MIYNEMVVQAFFEIAVSLLFSFPLWGVLMVLLTETNIIENTLAAWGIGSGTEAPHVRQFKRVQNACLVYMLVISIIAKRIDGSVLWYDPFQIVHLLIATKVLIIFITHAASWYFISRTPLEKASFIVLAAFSLVWLVMDTINNTEQYLLPVLISLAVILIMFMRNWLSAVSSTRSQ